jgi:hypothetical protein
LSAYLTGNQATTILNILFYTASYSGMQLNETQNFPQKPYTKKLSILFPVLSLKDKAY